MPTDKLIIGVIRSLEARMLDEAEFIHLISAEGFPFDYEAVLCQSMDELKKLSGSLAPENRSIAVLWERYDYENIKILIKAKFKEVTDPPLFSCGTLDPRKLKEKWKELISSAERIYADSKDFLAVFDFVDSLYLKHLKTAAEEEKSSLLLKWAEYLEDSSKIKPFLKQLDFAKYYTSGMEPLIAFLLNKEAEAKKLSLIYKCKENHMPDVKIKERIRSNG